MDEGRDIACALCGRAFKTQITRTHLSAAHNLTTKEYRALGHETISPWRLAQLRTMPVAQGTTRRPRGWDHHAFKGGHVNGQGYRIVYRDGKRIMEHRAVAEATLGRPLAPGEVVHHKDANRANNDPSNLEVMTREAHDRIKDSIRRFFHTGPHTEEAVLALYGLGWSISKIGHALRVGRSTVTSWLDKHGVRRNTSK